jgi:hypothetical protein
METTLIIAAVVLLLISLVLTRGIDWIMRAFGVQPVRPDERSRGLGDVIARVRDRLDQRRR